MLKHTDKAVVKSYTHRIEAIQLLQLMNIHPRCNVRFVAWMHEEFGGSGAETYGKEHAPESSIMLA